MTEQEVLGFINTLDDLKACYRVRQAAQHRAKDLEVAAHKRNVAEWWKQSKWWEAGKVLYCAAEGTFFGGPLQRGDSAKVYAVQSRKRTAWLTIGGKQYGFSAEMAFRYRLQLQPPTNPMSAEEPTKESGGKRGVSTKEPVTLPRY